MGKHRKTFAVMIGNDRRLITLGHYPDLALSDARRKAALLLNSPSTNPPLYNDVLDAFLAHLKKSNRPSSFYETKRLLDRHFPFQNQRLDAITYAPISKILQNLPPSEANHAFTALRSLFNWAIAQNLTEKSPLQNKRLPHKAKSRDRVLTDNEIKKIWAAAPSTAFGSIVRLLLLTGQRLGEIAALESGWLHDGCITFPAVITKNGAEHTIPIPSLAEQILRTHYYPASPALPQKPSQTNHSLCTSPNSTLLFPSSKTGMVIVGFQKMKRKLDKRSGVTNWTLHDLRRTFSTIHARIGTPPHVTEAILNHKTGTRTAIQRIYDRHNYLPQMREAMDRYDAYITQLCSAV